MKIKLTLLSIFMCFHVYAQQDAQYTQYMYNTININPAYAGTRSAISVFGLHRSQWIGLDGAPKTNTVSINSPIGETGLGIGGSLINDKIGPINSNSFSIDLSYTFDVSYDYKLSFGVKGSANLFKLDASQLQYRDFTDPNLHNISNELTPNFGTGVYLHSDKTYIGLSATDFLRKVTYNEVQIYKERLNLYLIGGHVFDVGYSAQFKPAFMAKAVQGAPLQLDVSGNFLFNERVSIGLAYRWSAAVSAMAGFQISNNFFIGYGYDFETTSLARYNSGSHEVFMRYEIFKRMNRVNSPRFF